MEYRKRRLVVEDIGLVKFDEAYELQCLLFEQHNSHKLLKRGRGIATGYSPLYGNYDGRMVGEHHHSDGKERGNADPHYDSDVPPPHFILFCEHYPVITIGVSGKETNLRVSEEFLTRKNIEFRRTNRGGDITYHGPGQIVMYPILDLEDFKEDIKWYIWVLEEAVIRTLGEFGIRGCRIEGRTGVWIEGSTPPEKICSIGIRCTRWITMHGIALNVNNDLTPFTYINPCGFTDINMTSMREKVGKEVEMTTVKKTLLYKFTELLGVQHEDIIYSGGWIQRNPNRQKQLNARRHGE